MADTRTLAELESLVDSELGVSDWVTVDQALVDGFAQVSGDHQFIHVDPERAQSETPFGGTIAHGFLTLSLISQLCAQFRRTPGRHGDGHQLWLGPGSVFDAR